MQKGPGSRSKQRRYALRILFEMDINSSGLEEVMVGKELVGESPPEGFTLELVNGVGEHLRELDGIISAYAEGWEIERMPLVDRNILRMSLYEMFHVDDVPPGVTIDEAVELAKAFSTEDSGKFVNGVLGSVYRDWDSGKLNLSNG